MSDLAEIRHALDSIRDAVTRTSQDVGWIKDGMEKSATRLDGHEERIGKLENRQHWYSGLSAAIGALLGIGGSHGVKF